MNAVINLNKARKAKATDDRRTQSEQNSVTYGRTKAEKILAATVSEKAKAKLDGLKFDDE